MKMQKNALFLLAVYSLDSHHIIMLCEPTLIDEHLFSQINLFQWYYLFIIYNQKLGQGWSRKIGWSVTDITSNGQLRIKGKTVFVRGRESVHRMGARIVKNNHDALGLILDQWGMTLKRLLLIYCYLAKFIKTRLVKSSIYFKSTFQIFWQSFTYRVSAVFFAFSFDVLPQQLLDWESYGELSSSFYTQLLQCTAVFFLCINFCWVGKL